MIFLFLSRFRDIYYLNVAVVIFPYFFPSIYVLTHVCRSRSGLVPLFSTYREYCTRSLPIFKWQIRAIFGNGWYRSKIHYLLILSQSDRIVSSRLTCSVYKLHHIGMICVVFTRSLFHNFPFVLYPPQKPLADHDYSDLPRELVMLATHWRPSPPDIM